MPTASRNERRKRRQKINLSRTRKQLRHVLGAQGQTLFTLFAILSKLGGEVEISAADLKSAGTLVGKAHFVIDPSAVEGNFMVRIVDNEEALQGSAQTSAILDPGPQVVLADPGIGESTETVEEPGVLGAGLGQELPATDGPEPELGEG